VHDWGLFEVSLLTTVNKMAIYLRQTDRASGQTVWVIRRLLLPSYHSRIVESQSSHSDGIKHCNHSPSPPILCHGSRPKNQRQDCNPSPFNFNTVFQSRYYSLQQSTLAICCTLSFGVTDRSDRSIGSRPFVQELLWHEEETEQQQMVPCHIC